MALWAFVISSLRCSNKLGSSALKRQCPRYAEALIAVSVGTTGQLSNLFIRELRVFAEFVNSAKGLAKLEIFAYRL